METCVSYEGRIMQVPMHPCCHSCCLLIFRRANFFSELYWGKVMAYTMPQQRKQEESEKLRGERDQIKFIDLGFERWQVVRFRKARGRQDVL